MRSRLSWLAGLTALAAALSACGQFSLDLVTPTVAVATEAPTQPVVTVTPIDKPADTPTPTQAPSATPQATPSAETPPIEGLTYSVFEDGIYRVDATGQWVK